MNGFSESHVEEAGLAFFKELGYAIALGGQLAPDITDAERQSYHDVLFMGR